MNEVRRSQRHQAASSLVAYLPIRLQSLFHNIPSEPILSSKMVQIHRNPNIFLIPDFLSDHDVEYFNQICTRRRGSFQNSFVEDSDNHRFLNEERTSTFTFLEKSGDQVCFRRLKHRECVHIFIGYQSNWEKSCFSRILIHWRGRTITNCGIYLRTAIHTSSWCRNSQRGREGCGDSPALSHRYILHISQWSPAWRRWNSVSIFE